jgi:hypothetical protein
LAFTIVIGTSVGAGATVLSPVFSHATETVVSQNLVFPEANRDSKEDRLTIAVGHAAASEPISYQLASADPSDVVEPAQSVDVAEPTQRAAASDVPTEDASNPATASIKPVLKPKPAAPKLPSAVMVRDNQIATIKERLRLTAAQEEYWPAVESALRGVLVQVYETKRRGGGALDTNSAEVQRLKSAAIPLLMQMREDQKREVRNFAQVIGLTEVASMI